ncbi:hypothetical protein KIJ05_08895 [Leuconostoc gelidum subsp. gasicomitatum]|uniref:hypothetical protein n=1 Tax=Leuconostoc gasicomitatum TaxID=115778 RepID=UPI001CC814AF|nr:hypothetical protein [Leuconostoc gasicomitatum]MBZ5985227.1 hypothetical protein [Leuconostoc gasicomitatum]
MDWKEYAKNIFGKIKNFWFNLSVKKKFLTIAIVAAAITMIFAGSIVKTHFDNKNLSPQMLQFKKDGTMFIELPEKVNENNNHTVYIKGQTAPKSHVQIGYGIFGDTTTSDNNGKFTLSYDDNIQQDTNIKITAKLNGKQKSRIITVVPSPKRQQEIKNKSKQINQYKKEAHDVESLVLKNKSFSDAKAMVLGISSSIDVKSNNKEITNVTDSDKVTDIKVNQTDTGVSVLLYLEPSDSAKKALADKKAEEQKSKDIENAKSNYKKNIEAYEVKFHDYAIEYLIDKNTSTIYETTTDDSSVSQSKFTGDMDTRINFDLDGLQMIAYHHYAGNNAVAYFNDTSQNSNKAYKMDPEATKNNYFKSINLPF